MPHPRPRRLSLPPPLLHLVVVTILSDVEFISCDFREEEEDDEYLSFFIFWVLLFAKQTRGCVFFVAFLLYYLFGVCYCCFLLLSMVTT